MKARFPAILGLRLFVIALGLSAHALAQEPSSPPGEDVHKQMHDLIARIELGLKHVDQLLWSADALPSEAARSNLAARLKAARDSSQSVLNDIDKLLEIRHHPHPGGGGGS